MLSVHINFALLQKIKMMSAYVGLRRVSLGFTGFHRVSQGFAWLHRVSLGFTGFRRVSQGFTGFIYGFHRVSQGLETKIFINLHLFGKPKHCFP